MEASRLIGSCKIFPRGVARKVLFFWEFECVYTKRLSRFVTREAAVATSGQPMMPPTAASVRGCDGREQSLLRNQPQSSMGSLKTRWGGLPPSSGGGPRSTSPPLSTPTLLVIEPYPTFVTANTRS